MRVLLALSIEQLRPAQQAAASHGHEVVGATSDAPSLLSLVQSTKPELVIVGGDPSLFTASVLDTCDRAGIRVLALVNSEEAKRNVNALGLFESVDSLADWTLVERVIEGRRAANQLLPQVQRGRVVAVWGPPGAPGRTSVAIAVAAELAAAGTSVVLVDADTHAASVAPAIGLLDEAPGFAAACRLAGSQSLTMAELDRVAERYSSSAGSFRVLTGIARSARWPELPGDRVTAVIRECRSWLDYTVVDVSHSVENDEEISSDLYAPRRNAATIAAIREADVVIAVAAADPIGLSRFLRAHVELLEIAPEAEVRVAVNKLRSSAIGIQPSAQVRQTLSRFGGIDDPFFVPHDVTAFDAALLSARTLVDVAPKSPARQALRELVTEWLLPHGAKPRGSNRPRRSR